MPLCLGLHSALSAFYLQACVCITAIPSTGLYFLACEQVLGIFNARVLVFSLNLACSGMDPKLVPLSWGLAPMTWDFSPIYNS